MKELEVFYILNSVGSSADLELQILKLKFKVNIF